MNSQFVVARTTLVGLLDAQVDGGDCGDGVEVGPAHVLVEVVVHEHVLQVLGELDEAGVAGVVVVDASVAAIYAVVEAEPDGAAEAAQVRSEVLGQGAVSPVVFPPK